MSNKRKISIRKVIQTFVTLIVVTGFVVAILSADRLQNHKKIHSVQVHIRNSNTVHFLDNEEVMKMLFTDRHLDATQSSIAKLNVHQLEEIIKSNAWVSDAQVYVDNERNLHIYLAQRVPVVRIFEGNGNTYYMDTALQTMPLSDHYVHYTPVVTGAPRLGDDSNSRQLKGQIAYLVDYIAQHKFWNAQTAQIVVTEDQNFELIPILGKQRILLGDTSRLEEKLDNLFAFYQQVSNKVGWDKYEKLDLRFHGQVIASPSLPWKAPQDRALSNMNWVKAVMDSGPKDDKDEAATNNGGDPVAAIPSAVQTVVTGNGVRKKPSATVVTPPPARIEPAAPVPLKAVPAVKKDLKKPGAKSTAKLAVKPMVKPGTKQTAKAASKTVAKNAAKPGSRTPLKAAVKPGNKKVVVAVAKKKPADPKKKPAPATVKKKPVVADKKKNAQKH